MLGLEYIFNINTIIIIGALYSLYHTFIENKRGRTGRDVIGDLHVLARPKRKPLKLRQPRRNVNEERCRTIFEDLFQKPFPSCRPDFLKNKVVDTKRNLELDGYCPDIVTPLGKGLAFEYDGLQHRQYVPHFHKYNPHNFVYQVKKDTFKSQQCKKMGIVLIRIPDHVPPDNLKKFILTRLRSKQVPIPSRVADTSSPGRFAINTMMH